MGDFAEAMEAAAAGGGNDSPPASPSVPADSGSTAPDPASDSTTTPPDASTPADADASGSSPVAGAKPAAAAAAPLPPTPSGMVPAPALKEAREQLKTLRETYGWMPKEHAGHLRTFYEGYVADPLQAALGLLEELLASPQHGPRLKAMAGVGAASDAEPQPDLKDHETGELVYSAAQTAKWREWKDRQHAATIDERLRPVQSFIDDQRHRELATEMRTKAATRARELFEPLRANPHFETHKDAIKARFRQHVQTMPGEAALYRAFSEVLNEEVIPGLSRTARADVVGALQRKPGASSPSPTRRAPANGTKARPAGFREAAEQLFGR